MYFTYQYKTRGSCQRLYAVGDREAVVQALRETFNNHGMPIHSEKNQEICHYPGGWFDRATTAYAQFSTSGGIPPQSDHFSVTYKATNNPFVTILRIDLYHKTGWFRDKKVQARIKGFFEALEHEFRIFQLPIIEADDWPEFVALYPQFFCSPVWRTTAEVKDELNKSKNDRNG